jgi:hypothetical protein
MEKAIRLSVGDSFWLKANYVDSKHIRYKIGDLFTADAYSGMLVPFSLVYPPGNSTVGGTFLLCDIVYKKRHWFEFFKVRMPEWCVFKIMDNGTKIS